MSSHSNRLNDSKLLYVISDLGYSKDCSVITGIELLNEVKNYIPIPSILMSIPLIFFCLATGFLSVWICSFTDSHLYVFFHPYCNSIVSFLVTGIL